MWVGLHRHQAGRARIIIGVMSLSWRDLDFPDSWGTNRGFSKSGESVTRDRVIKLTISCGAATYRHARSRYPSDEEQRYRSGRAPPLRLR